MLRLLKTKNLAPWLMAVYMLGLVLLPVAQEQAVSIDPREVPQWLLTKADCEPCGSETIVVAPFQHECHHCGRTERLFW